MSQMKGSLTGWSAAPDIGEEDTTFSEDISLGTNGSASWLYYVRDAFKPLSPELPSEDDNVSYGATTGNITIADYPPMNALGFELQAFLIALYSLTALLALGGNVMVIVVLVLGRRSSRELRLFLVNLALSDIAMAVFSIPFTYTDFMLGRWIFEPLFCPVVLFMQHVSVIVSVYTLTAIGVDRQCFTNDGVCDLVYEVAYQGRNPQKMNNRIFCSAVAAPHIVRYYAIMSPLSFRWTRKRGPHIILVIWLVAAMLSSVQFVHGRATPFTWADGTYYDCHENWDEKAGKIYTAVIFTVTFLTPMLVLTFTYSSIGWKMWRHTSPGNADIQRDQQQMTAKMKVVKMLATVVLMFAVCWLPIHLMNLILYFDRAAMQPDTAEQEYLYIAAFFSCHWFSMANSFVNPIIYCFMSDNFRVDLRQMMVGCCSPVRTNVNLTLTKRSCSYGASLRSSTVVMSTAVAGANQAAAGSSVRRQQRSNGFHAASSAVVPLRTLGRPGQHPHTTGGGGSSQGAQTVRVPIYA